MDPTNRIIRNVPRGTTEKWLLRGGGGWPHPVHVHLVDFKITSRVALKPEYNAEAGRNYIAPYEAAAMKDVVAIGNNEEVTILAKYAPW